MSINKVFIMGNLGGDPVAKDVQSGKIVNFSVATKEGRDGEKTEWHNIVCFGKVAENCEKYIKKGSQVFVEGRISTSEWKGPDGAVKKRTDIVASAVQFLSKPEFNGSKTNSFSSNQTQVPNQKRSGPFDDEKQTGSFEEYPLPF